MKVKDFKKLKKGDKVLIPAPEGIKAVDDRIVAILTSPVKIDTKKGTGIGTFKPGKFYRKKETSEPIRLDENKRTETRYTNTKVHEYTWEYHHISLYNLRTEYDQLAIADPAGFMRTTAGYSWENAKKFYKKFKKWEDGGKNDDPPPESLSHPGGGMQALLDYRSYLAGQLIREIADEARTDAIQRRERVVKNNDDFNLAGVDFQPFIEGTKAPGGDAPGSKEPTSDIDLNTFNDGTEYLVKAFNRRFADDFDGYEPGIVFDVNVYGKDFLPKFGSDFEISERAESGERRFEIPERDHVFLRREYEDRDAQRQLEAALLKLRRYMADRTFLELSSLEPAEQMAEILAAKEWETFKGMVDDLAAEYPNEYLKLLPFGKIEKKFVFNLEWLADQVTFGPSRRPSALQTAQNANTNLLRQAVTDVLRQDIAIELTRLDPENTEDLNTLMAAENRIYETKLQRLADTRTKFDCAKFANLKTVDIYYLTLRTAVSSALFFANEAYVTAGAVTQVVGGKQKLSRGVKAEDRTEDQEASANIAYGVDELMHSIIDNLADIYKETKRHYKHHPDREEDPLERLGAAVLKSSKYIHRMFNAIKHLYVISGIVEAYDDKKIGEDAASIWGAALMSYPKKDFPNHTSFRAFLKTGFGLEALKKLELDWSKADDEEALKTLLVNKFSLDGDPGERAHDILLPKIRGQPAPKEVEEQSDRFHANEVRGLMVPWKKLRASTNYMAASLIIYFCHECLRGGPGLALGTSPLTLTIEQLRTALTYLVVDVMADYAAFRGTSKTTIAAAMRAAKRPYPLPGLVPTPSSEPVL